MEPLGDGGLFGEREEQRLVKQAILQPFFLHFLEFGGVFVGENQLVGAEAVLEGVLAGARLAFRAGGSGGAVGILSSEAAIERFRTRLWREAVRKRGVAGR
jgi:hypothetical protein